MSSVPVYPSPVPGHTPDLPAWPVDAGAAVGLAPPEWWSEPMSAAGPDVVRTLDPGPEDW